MICKLFHAVVRCGILPNPRNGQVSTDDPPTYGTQANYTCDEGYVLLGTSSRLCQDSQWSGSPPECAGEKKAVLYKLCTTVYNFNLRMKQYLFTPAVDCGSLMDPLNGTVTHAMTTFQSVADYSCAVGYTLVNGPETRLCQSNGVWSGTQPSCQSEFEV